MNLDAALKIIFLLEKCPCDICKKELERMHKKYGFIKKDNKGQAGNMQAERLNPEGAKSVCDSPTSENK